MTRAHAGWINLSVGRSRWREELIWVHLERCRVDADRGRGGGLVGISLGLSDGGWAAVTCRTVFFTLDVEWSISHKLAFTNTYPYHF